MSAKPPSLQKRPVNLNFFTIRFPVTAYASFGHRVSGVFLFFCIPLLLWILQESLASDARFLLLQLYLSKPFFKVCIFLFVSALFYHLIAGIRHLAMDLHFCESKIKGKITAWIVWIVWMIGSVFFAFQLF